MKIRGAVQFLLLVVVLPLAAAAMERGDTISPDDSGVRKDLASKASPVLPEIYLVPGCRDCLSVDEVNLASGIVSPSREPFKVVSSQLIFMDAHGEVLFTIADPYGFDGSAEIWRSASGFYKTGFQKKVTQLDADSYTAVLKVNDLFSNVVGFNVRAIALDFKYSKGSACPGSLSIEPLVDIHGKDVQNAFMAYFRNLSGDSVSLAGSTARSRLLVHGKEYRLKVFFWAGISDLSPGKPWGTVVDLSSFVDVGRKPVEVGNHQIQYKFGDCWSNVIQVNVEGEQAQP